MYRTVSRAATAEFTERHSRFIGYVWPVTSGSEVVEHLDDLRREHWDARHHVSAFVLREGNICRFSDDGEPQGTAGMPVLDVIRKNGLCDCAVVVVRYFGGILLGGGGLVRAYGHAASLAIEAAGITEMREGLSARVACTYAQYGWLAPLIASMEGTVTDTAFTEAVEMTFTLPETAWRPLVAAVIDRSAGTVMPMAEKPLFLPFPVE